MFTTIFLGPGRVILGESLSDAGRHRRFRQSSFRRNGPVAVVSLVFWTVLTGAGVFLCSVFGTNVDPPPPPQKAQVEGNKVEGNKVEANNAKDRSYALSSANASPAQTPAQAQAAPDVASSKASGPLEAKKVALTQPPEAWLVILESIPKSARPQAERALEKQKKKGLNVELFDTDAYPRLKSGLWALGVGPFDTKKEALEASEALKPKFKGLMVRRGL
jgi:cytoskeletal protein RodZ